ncbi:MAG: hypothetical protein A2017_04870 [Lentisphaerae bacterium GWF2_44_16]|nr:MAG: hypothetical protein A2017_04870 [Lentisphaerae bacterium GWF2_44_16]
MKSIIFFLCMTTVLFFSLSAMARLRGGPIVESIGIFDENPSHIAIIFKENGKSIASFDCGSKWDAIRKENLPEKLYPLPSTGKIRYQIAGATIICSENAGLTWKDISPSFFLSCQLRDKIKESRQRFKNKFSLWLPEYQFWPLPFSISSFIIVLFASIVLARRRESWRTAMLLSLFTYFLIGTALWCIGAYFITMLCDMQWTGLMAGSWGGMIYPRWPLGIILLLCGSPYLAPITAAICLPLTPLFGTKIMTESRSGRILRLVWITVALAFIIFIPLALFFGRSSDYYDFP